MSSILEKLSKKLLNHLILAYLISFSVGAIVFVIIMFLFNWNFGIFFEIPFFLVFTIISGVIMKFLGGLGISITYVTFCTIILRIFRKQLKGKKRAIKGFKIFFIILGVIICLYGLYVLISSIIFFLQPIDLIERFTSVIFGIFTLMIFVFFIPLVQDAYRPFEKESLWNTIKGKFGGFKYSLWRGYQSRIRKDYGKVHIAEYERLKDNVEDIRDQISGFLLPSP